MDVTQVSNLLYRSASSLRMLRHTRGATVTATLCRLEIGDTAGWKPALNELACLVNDAGSTSIENSKSLTALPS